VVYEPPQESTEGEALMDNLISFIRAENDGLDQLLRMAIAHHQFEIIHPFYDGNGRTDRILNLLILQREGLLNVPALYLSRNRWPVFMARRTTSTNSTRIRPSKSGNGERAATRPYTSSLECSLFGGVYAYLAQRVHEMLFILVIGICGQTPETVATISIMFGDFRRTVDLHDFGFDVALLNERIHVHHGSEEGPGDWCTQCCVTRVDGILSHRRLLIVIPAEPYHHRWAGECQYDDEGLHGISW